MKPILQALAVLAGLHCVTACTHLFGNLRSSCGVIAAPEEKLLKQGYYPMLRRCEYIYCHNGPRTGSQLVVRECTSAAVLLHKAQDAQDIFNRKDERPPVCSVDGCRDP
jgi:hypothetical protein